MDPEPTTTPADVQGDGRVAKPAPALHARTPLYRRTGALITAAVVLLLLVGGGAWYWHYASTHISTDSAFIEGRIVRISSRVAGQVAQLAVHDNQWVKESELLVRIDDREYRALAEQAEAQARAAEVAAQNAAVDAGRAKELFARQLIARQAFDLAEATARTRAAEAEAARKQAAEAALRLSFTRIVAPEAGRVTNRTVEEGATVQIGQSLMAIVPNDFWVVANFKETQLDDIRPGAPAEIEVDAYPGMRLRGHVDSIQAGTGARFSLLPPENATGNYVKVVQRVPVKIVFDELPRDPTLLGPGMSVVPTVIVR
jgi:membrane fusion protein (multidrug efflux system)